MKIFIPYSSNSATPSEYVDDAEKAVGYLKQELGRIFDENYTILVKLDKFGNKVSNLNVVVLNVPETATSLERMNAPMQLMFMMHLMNGKAQQVDMDKFELEILKSPIHAKQRGFKYRKISGTSPIEVAKKLVKWFKDNEELLKNW